MVHQRAGLPTFQPPASGVIMTKASDSKALSEPLRTDDICPGEVLADKYVVERVIGIGGIAIVLAARHVELDETVAIKVLQPAMQARTETLQRFAREAKAAVRIKSEHAARVFDVGVAPGRGPFLVMEYLEGHDLAGHLAVSGPLPIKRAAEYVIQACEALAVAHANGIVHRDIKPENMFLARRADGTEVLKVLDFGISKTALTSSVFGVATDTLKTQELMMGTPVYMSPEQIRETAAVDHRTDIWSLGASLYELVTGELAFPGETITKICAHIIEGEPAPMTRWRADVPLGLQAIVSRCLAKNVDDRFQNVAELAAAMLPYAPSRSRHLVERVSATLNAAGCASGAVMRFDSDVPPHPDSRPTALVPPAPGSDSTRAAVENTVTIAKRPRSIAALLGAVAALVLLGGIAWWITHGSPEARPSAAQSGASQPITIVTEPPGARVEWEGKLLGETPLSATLPVGVHALTLSRTGYGKETVSVTITADDPKDHRVQLTLNALGTDRPSPSASPSVSAPRQVAPFSWSRTAGPKAGTGGGRPSPSTTGGQTEAAAPVKPNATQSAIEDRK